MRLIDADLLSEAIHENVSAPYEDAVCAKEDCLTEVYEAPTVDAVPVVRCRECEHWDGSVCDVHSEWPDQYSTGHMDYTEADDFCSYGEPKEGNE